MRCIRGIVIISGMLSMLSILSILSMSGCTLLEGGIGQDKMSKYTRLDIKIGECSAQEYISGKEGEKGSLVFLIHIESAQDSLMPDSLIYSGYHGKLYVKDEVSGLYRANVPLMNGASVVPIDKIILTFAGVDYRWTSPEGVHVIILPPVHLP